MTTARTFRTEFPEFDPATMPAIPADWTDCSWHNDTCPSFIAAGVQDYAAPGWWTVSVFVDFLATADREFPGTPRFQVVFNDDGGARGLFATDDWSDVLDGVADVVAVRHFGLEIMTSEQAFASQQKPATVLTVVEIFAGIFMVYENGKPVLDDEKFVGRSGAVAEARRRAGIARRNATFAEDGGKA